MSNTTYNTDICTINQLKWKAHYDKLCARGKSRATTRKEANKIFSLVEKHHIIPEFFFIKRARKGPNGWLDGNPNDKSNFVFLTPREHYVAHQLLVKIYPHIPGLVNACHIMTVNKDGNRVNNREYEWLKIGYSKATSKRQKGQTKDNCERCRKQSAKTLGVPKPEVSEALTGRRKETDEGYQKISEILTGRTKDTHDYLMAKSIQYTGQTKETNAGVAKMTATKTGRTKHTHKGHAVHAEKMLGRRKENNSGCRSASEKLSVLTIEERKELVQLRDSGIKPKAIWIMFNERGTRVAYSTLCNMYTRVKKEMETSDFYN